MINRYVNPASSGGNGTTSALSGANAAYASLSSAEAEWGALSDAWTITCDTDGTADTSAVTINGSTTTAENYILIQCTNRHSGVLTTAKYRLTVANDICISIQDEYIRLDGLQIVRTSSNSNALGCISTASLAAANEIRVSNCIIKQAGNNSYTEPCLYTGDSDTVWKIWNTLCYGAGTAAGTNNACFVAYGTGAALYNCTFIGNTVGVRCGSGDTIVAKNCYACGSVEAYSVAGTLTKTTCASSDTTGSIGLQNIAKNTTNFKNVTAGSEDFHLPSGSALIGVGTDDVGEGLFSTDIDGQTRTSVWDIGADEYISGYQRYVSPLPAFRRPS